MAKVYLICGKICSGKSYYSKKLQEEVNAVILSPDEATYDLINNEQGEFYNVFCDRLINYMNKKCVEIVKAGANVIFERGLEERNKRVEEGSGGSDFYLDEGLMKKLASKFEEPTEDEVDVWYENDYMNRKLK